jgi:hypothetical protein
MLEFNPTPTLSDAEEASETPERYASLLSRARSGSAQQIVARLSQEIEQHEQSTGARVRKRRAKSSAKLSEAVERFVGDLLRVRVGEGRAGRIYRATGKSDFADDPVKYDVFMRALDGLKALGYIEHAQGQSRYRTVEFDPGDKCKYKVPGQAARFWATSTLVELAEQHGITGSNIREHFTPEPPSNPLVLKGFATGRGRNRENGPVIRDYERTPEIERLAADVRELNAFLAGFKIAGGEHDGYVRIFNNNSWKKGGRLYSIGGGYQLLPLQQRVQMKINGESLYEIDIRASFLTIYHALVGEPLKSLEFPGEPLKDWEDPYARVADVPRDVAKLWCVQSFGNSAPKTKWPPGVAADYLEDTGRQLPKAADVARKMLEAFPALQQLSDHPHIWADLQYMEAEAVLGTMLRLMREQGLPSLAMHDGRAVSTKPPRIPVGRPLSPYQLPLFSLGFLRGP